MDEFKGEFPNDLKEVTTSLANHVGYKMIPEAATLNYYPHSRQAMCGHLDNAEGNLWSNGL